jgi:Mitochondrial K+-H+ exchange-related
MFSVPNIPGFYLLFRTYSHYRALYGAKHLEYLVTNNLISPTPSKILDQVYAAGLMSSADPSKTMDPKSLTSEDVNDIASDFASQVPDEVSESDHQGDVMFLNKASGVAIAGAFEVSEMAVEIERAVEQVEKTLQKKS